MTVGSAWLLLLAAAGSIEVRLVGANEPVEVTAWSGGVARRTVRAEAGAERVRIGGLPPGSYDLQARSKHRSGPPVRGVRAVRGGSGGFDATLHLEEASPLRFDVPAGATVHVDGIPHRGREVLATAGLHRVAVSHPSLLSSAERLVRIGVEERTVAQTLDAGRVVTGVVRGTDGAALAGAQVELFADGFPVGRRVWTDAQGRFALGGFRGDVVSVAVGALGRATVLRRVPFFPEDLRAQVEVELGAGSAVTVAATDGAGRPVADAEAVLLPAWYERVLEEPRLRANHRPARRRGGVRFRFGGLVPGRRYRILLTRPGGVARATPPFAAPPAGETRALQAVALGRAAALGGVVRESGGRPVAGVAVVCEGPEGRLRIRTDREGRYRFGELEAGEHRLRVHHRDERPRTVSLAGGTAGTLDWTLPAPDPERFVAGTAYDADGKPMAGVIVETADRRAVSGEDGAFRLEGLPPGRDRFEVAFRPGPGCRGLLRDPHQPGGGVAVRTGGQLVLHLVRSHRLRVRLLSEEGAPARADLVLRGPGGLRLSRRLATGAARVEIENLPAGSYVVEVAAPGYAGTGGAVLQLPHAEEEASLRVIAGRAAAGRVVRRRAIPRPGKPSGFRFEEEPPQPAWVALLGGGPLRRGAVTRVEEDGAFLLRGLPPEPVVLCAASPGLAPAFALVDLRTKDAADVKLELFEPVSAEIRVLDAKGNAVEGAHVRVQTRQGLDVRDLLARARFQGTVADETDFRDAVHALGLERPGAGRVRARFLAPGSYRFRVTADGYLPASGQVRALAAWSRAAIREYFPDGEMDLAVEVRLAPAPPR